MFLPLALITLTLVIGLGILLTSVRHAPDGYEDADGFHFKGKAPQVTYAQYNAFADRQPKTYPARRKVSAPRMAA